MDETLQIAGLSAPAEIRIDRWGIPHLTAGSEADLFFLQGFNAARDRLWQIDLWRKRGLGLLAADFGPGYLAQDHAARHFLYRGDMAAEWAFYAPDAQAICTAFTRGINAYIALCDREPARLPPEFALFGTRPAPWRPEDVVRIRTHALSRNGLSELLRAIVTARAGAEIDLLRASIDPPVAAPDATPEALAGIALEALQLLKLATAPVTFEAERLAAQLDAAWSWVEVTDLGDIVAATTEEGSNNWVVHGSRTETGRPILASDPHRTHALPSLRYLVHLTAPGFDAIGCGEPSAPGISLGHNGRTAFGLTIFPADQEDIHVYETRPDAADSYRYGDGWTDVTRVEETFAVKGLPDQRLTLSFTRHGPVLWEDAARTLLIAFRSVWDAPGGCAYMGALSAMRAGSVAEFGASLAHWGAPTVNHVCADVAGDIGWFTAGNVPRRPNWRGLAPVPGDGSHEWRGVFAPQDLPRMVNPAKGFLATANEMNLPADRPAEAMTIGHEWNDPSRARRIHAVLAADPAHSVSKAGALQADVVSIPAQRVCALLPEGGAGAAFLAGWDGSLDAQSAQAALFELWLMKHLRPALLARFCPDPKIRKLLLPGDMETLLPILEAPEKPPFRWNVAERDALIESTLEAAFDHARSLMGEPADWRWGRLHHGYFEHPATRLNRDGAGGWDIGPLPVGGSRYTVMNAGYRLGDFRVTSGASVRLVMDVGDWDKSVCINTPGQSGDPRSPHYGDLAQTWAAGGFVPLLYSAAAVEAATGTVIRLIPDAGGEASA